MYFAGPVKGHISLFFLFELPPTSSCNKTGFNYCICQSVEGQSDEILTLFFIQYKTHSKTFNILSEYKTENMCLYIPQEIKAFVSQLTTGHHGFTTRLKEYLVVLYKCQMKTLICLLPFIQCRSSTAVSYSAVIWCLRPHYPHCHLSRCYPFEVCLVWRAFYCLAASAFEWLQIFLEISLEWVLEPLHTVSKPATQHFVFSWFIFMNSLTL